MIACVINADLLFHGKGHYLQILCAVEFVYVKLKGADKLKRFQRLFCGKLDLGSKYVGDFVEKQTWNSNFILTRDMWSGCD
jgi:hypothetical protein